MRRRRDSNSLAGQVVAANVLMVVATLFAASAMTHLNLRIEDQRVQFGLLGLSIALVLLVNMLMLRRRFSPLDRLIERVEAIDPAEPAGFEAPEADEAVEEIDRLAASFRRLLSRIDEERNRSGRLVLRAQEEERRRLARDLQALHLSAPPGTEEALAELKRLVNQAMDELLRLARQLRPAALDDHGLTSAIVSQVRRFSSQTGIRAEVKAHGERMELEPDQEIAVYRFAQEALSNVVQHADASNVEVDLTSNGNGLELSVRDDGRGFDPDAPRSGVGLIGLAERARMVGAQFEIESSPGRGTALTLQVP
ncbi:MAG: sensor histidine kinase [Actinobacteria bacterium]|nr:MAG: sensor histidine kinase [Actinomycetota bacterium]